MSDRCGNPWAFIKFLFGIMVPAASMVRLVFLYHTSKLLIEDMAQFS